MAWLSGTRTLTKSGWRGSIPKVHALSASDLTISVLKKDLILNYLDRHNFYWLAEIRPQVGGIVKKSFFEEGQDVTELTEEVTL